MMKRNIRIPTDTGGPIWICTLQNSFSICSGIWTTSDTQKGGPGLMKKAIR